jgi:uncharacterized protein (TIGR02594 family)
LKDPAWLAWARAELGVHETPGPASTARIIEYRDIAGIPLGGEDGRVPWCAIFVNAALRSAGLNGSGNGMARGFLRWGMALDGPAKGAITVLSSSRGPTTGHVSFYVGETDTHVRLLGGNQGDAVSIASFPKSRVLGYRWPEGVDLPAIGPLYVAGSGPAKPVSDA